MVEKMKHGNNNESKQPFKGISGTWQGNYLLKAFLEQKTARKKCGTWS
jgi:hypothetical protein